MLVGYSTATEITTIVAGFFLLLVLIVVARSIFRSEDKPTARRFRFGVFVERDHDDTSAPETTSAPLPRSQPPADSVVDGPPEHETEAPTRTDWPQPS